MRLQGSKAGRKLFDRIQQGENERAGVDRRNRHFVERRLADHLRHHGFNLIGDKPGIARAGRQTALAIVRINHWVEADHGIEAALVRRDVLL